MVALFKWQQQSSRLKVQIFGSFASACKNPLFRKNLFNLTLYGSINFFRAYIGDHGKIKVKASFQNSQSFSTADQFYETKVVYFSIPARCGSLCANFHAWAL